VTTISTEEIINEIKAEETAALSWGNKLFSVRPLIKTTKEVAKDAKEKSFTEPFVISRNKRFDTIASAAMASLFTVLFGYILFAQKHINIPASLFILVMISAMFYVLYKNLTLPTLNYTITLTGRQIDFGDIVFSWDEIQETFIVYSPQSKGYLLYLILGLKNGELDRHDINNFLTFTRSEKDISYAIEYFKKKRPT
jgi:hypothetical protein